MITLAVQHRASRLSRAGPPSGDLRRGVWRSDRDPGNRRARLTAHPARRRRDHLPRQRARVRRGADPAARPRDGRAREDPAIPHRSASSTSASWGSRSPNPTAAPGGSFFHSVLAVEELSRVDPSVGVLVDVQNTLVINALLRWGSDDVKRRYLPQLAATTVGAYALSEAGSGSDAFALTTRAREDGDAFVLTGRKLWITNGNEADLFIVFANVNPEAGYRGITAFLVERGFDGFHGRQEGGQARHPRQQHVRADPRRLPRAARERARRGRQGLQDRHRDAQRGAHRHRRADDRPRRRARSSTRSRTRRSGSSSASRSPSSRRCSTSSRAPPTDVEAARADGLQRGAPARRGPAVPHRGRDVQDLLVGSRRARRRRWR